MKGFIVNVILLGLLFPIAFCGTNDGLIRVGLKKLKLDEKNRLAARIEASDGEGLRASIRKYDMLSGKNRQGYSSGVADIVALKNYIDALF